MQGMGCLNTIPMLLREELITHLYYLLQSECGEKFISEAGTAVISFSPYSVSKRVKHHLALPMKVLVKVVTPKCLGGPLIDRD
ncbi:UNVERIFIED_CONTAM: hypothetical protein NCL1_38842 [Trichonephila clavipes]